MNFKQVNEWIADWMESHSDLENPDDILDETNLRVGAVSILQFARDSKLIDSGEYQLGLSNILDRI